MGARDDRLGYLPQVYDFKDGRLLPNDRRGLGAALDQKQLTYTTYYAGMC